MPVRTQADGDMTDPDPDRPTGQASSDRSPPKTRLPVVTRLGLVTCSEVFDHRTLVDDGSSCLKRTALSFSLSQLHPPAWDPSGRGNGVMIRSITEKGAVEAFNTAVPSQSLRPYDVIVVSR